MSREGLCPSEKAFPSTLCPLSYWCFIMSLTFKVWRSNSMANTMAIGICVEGEKDCFYGGKQPYRETHYYNPKTKLFCPSCEACWFSVKEAEVIKLEFLSACLGETFQAFIRNEYANPSMF